MQIFHVLAAIKQFVRQNILHITSNSICDSLHLVTLARSHNELYSH